MCKYSLNPFRKDLPAWEGPAFEFLHCDDMLDFHRSIPGYDVTPLRSLPDLAEALGVKEIYCKDESQRFGIKAFKALGASYAVYRFLKKQPPGARFTFCAATDGNHGRAVAWTAARLGQDAVIYMPQNTAAARIRAIESEGARVVLVPGTFDDCVARCARDAADNGRQAISDTAYAGYEEIPRYIMLGYTTIFRELEPVLHGPERAGFDVLLLPAGVGGIAAAGCSYYVGRYGARRPTLICVEPGEADCFLESIRFGNGDPLPTRGKLDSMMVGLDCGIPSPVAWPIVRDTMDLFIAVSDDYVPAAMRAYYRAGITSGESGAAGLAGLLALLKDKRLARAKEKIGLGADSRVLLVNTEGDTDPENYRRIVAPGGESYGPGETPSRSTNRGQGK